MEAVFEALFLTRGHPQQLSLDLDETERRLDREWKVVEEREKRSRTLFAQGAIRPEEVARELREAAAALGDAADTERFVIETAARLNAGLARDVEIAGALPGTPRADVWQLNVDALPEGVAVRSGLQGRVKVAFRLPVPDGVRHIARTHPLVEAMSASLLDAALDGEASSGDAAGHTHGIVARCGAIRTHAVATRTHLLLLRLRFHLEVSRRGRTTPLVAEECVVAAFRGRADEAEWLPHEEALALMAAEPSANVPPEQRAMWLEQTLSDLPLLEPGIAAIAHERAGALLASHQRVREAAGIKGASQAVRPHLPADILGLYVLMPAVRG
jgi:hypothetical protein